MAMDPTGNLMEQFELANEILESEYVNVDDAARLAELVLALHTWITRGGALPDQWRR